MPAPREINRTARIVAATALAVVLLGAIGCGGDQADTRSETNGMPSILQDLQNDDWVLDQAASTPNIRSEQAVTLSFGDHSVHGTGPCNVYRGSLDIARHSVEDDSIAINQLATQTRSCGAAVDRAEAAYFAALEAVTTVDVDRSDDRLTLTEDGGDVHLEFTTYDDHDLLVGRWKVANVARQGSLSTVVTGTEPILELADGGDLTLVTGCNDAHGSFELEGNELSVGPLRQTRKLCPEPEGVMAQESALTAAVESAVRVEVAPGRLTLVGPHDTATIVAVPAT